MTPKIKTIITVITLSIVLANCGGRAAHPIMVNQYGDDGKGCAALQTEMDGILQQIDQLAPETSKGGKNTALGVTGAFLIIPWFFMDFSHAEQEEIIAYQNRYNHLAAIAADKGCGHPTGKKSHS